MSKNFEDKFLRPALTFLLKTLFRVEIKGLENYAAAGDKVIIASNHQSFIDPLLLSVFIPEKPAFAMNVHQADKWYFKWTGLLLKTYKIDPLAPMSMKSLMNDVKKGAKVVIFPEGRITTSGGIMKIYDGTGRIIEKTGAVLLPVHIDGAQYSKLGKLGKKLRTRFFPKITVTILPPKKYASAEQVTSLMIYDELTRAAFEAANYRRPLLAAMLEAAELHGNNFKIATDITRTKLSYRNLFTRSFILKEKLQKILDGEQFVAMMLPNALAVPVTFVALQMLGKIPAMLNFSAGEKNILHACNLATAKTILTSRAFIEKGGLEHIAAVLEQKYKVVYLEDIRSQVTLVDKLLALGKAFFARKNLEEVIGRTAADDPAVILFTSGSEGTPKGVALSHANLLANIYQSCAILDLTEADVLFNAMPVFHSFGLTVGMIMPIVRGVNVFLYPGPVHYRVIPELVYDIDATVMIGTDTFFNGYARYANQYDFRSVRLAVAGAEKLKESTKHLYAEKFGVQIMQGYGVTEASPVIACNTALEHKSGSVGRLLPGIEAKVEPVAGLTQGGKLSVKGANIMLGYIKADNVGKVVPGEERYDTGDIVDIDEKGFVTILGRAKRFAKIAGEMVSLMIPEELALHLFPEHVHAAMAVADERKGEHIVLYSECECLTRDDLLKLAKEKGQPEIALPKHIHHISEIPRLGSGKIDYPELARRMKASEG